MLGCMDQSFAFAIPWNILHEHLPSLNTTTIERGTYWHLHVVEGAQGQFALLLPKHSTDLGLNQYKVALDWSQSS